MSAVPSSVWAHYDQTRRELIEAEIEAAWNEHQEAVAEHVAIVDGLFAAQDEEEPLSDKWPVEIDRAAARVYDAAARMDWAFDQLDRLGRAS